MAIKSMTGFGRGEIECNGRVWTAEVRCVNNRYLDLKMKLPRGYTVIEERIRSKVSELYLRGRVDLFLSLSGDFSEQQEIKVNMPLAAGYRDALAAIADEFGLQCSVTPELLAGFPDVLVREQKDDDIDAIWPEVEKIIDVALQGCDAMRRQEGAALTADLNQRLEAFSQTVTAIENSIPVLVEQRQKTVQERLEKLLGNIGLDPVRLSQEVAVMADKTDVTEEIVRLRSHIEQFTLFLLEEGGVGRKLDFLIQEFLREVNTLASKISDANIAHLTVDLKSGLEKMREQIQNIE
ncbi:MAG: YicC/YloC family endoribonuclease [Desulforhopalus sp.]